MSHTAIGEVLAPAGSPEAAKAAVRGGADAIYLGYGDFNARRNAKNFTKEELRETVAYCHQNRVAVFAALNTLVFPGEETRALDTARELAEAGVDAFILQDLGLARLLQKQLPQIPLHASTQLSVHNMAGAAFLREAGFTRVVLAREMSLEEIEAVHKALPELELEVFVHGALCMSVSGQCYFSAALGGRSGNRGLCAQTCRLPFAAAGRSHGLSLKDMSYVTHLPALLAAGVTSLKIEGRMKRPEYVAIASLAVRQAVDGLPADPEVHRLLRNAFSRSGFTDGYLTGRRGGGMFGMRTREDTADTAEALRRINALTRNVYPRLPLNLTLTAKAGQPLVLTVKDLVSGQQVTVTGDAPEPAVREGELSRVKEALSRLGGTPYRAETVTVEGDDGLFLPVSALNDLRRRAIDGLVFEKPMPVRGDGAGRSEPPEEVCPDTVIRAEAPSALPSPLPRGYEGSGLWFPLSSVLREEETVALLVKEGHKVAVELPRFLPVDREAATVDQLVRLRKAGVTAGVCGNVGHIPLVKAAGLVPVGGFGLNVTNGQTDAFFRERGVAVRTVSFERPAGKSLFTPGENLSMVYGRFPLMLTRNCPLSGERGCLDCRHAGRGGRLTDRKGESFPVVCRGGHAEVLNSRPLWLGDRELPFHKLFYFTVERAQEAARVLTGYREGRPSPVPFTRGMSVK